MGRPRKLETLTAAISGRIRPDQAGWLRYQADARFEGELSRALRWALDQAQTFDWILRQPDPVEALDEVLHPEKYEPPSPAEQEARIAEAERELEAWQREQAVKRAQQKRAKS
jgi:hypothetical protein